MDSEAEALLIDQVRDQPSLWDKEHPDFKNQTRKNSAWIKIANNLKEKERNNNINNK